MQASLNGERKIDNYWEKTHDWELFTKLILSTWIKKFDPKNEVALDFAKRWASVIEETFSDGAYNAEAYQNAYYTAFGKSLYLAAVEILSEYGLAKHKLDFVVNWVFYNSVKRAMSNNSPFMVKTKRCFFSMIFVEVTKFI